MYKHKASVAAALLGASTLLFVLPVHAAFDGSYILDNWTLDANGSNGFVTPSSGASATVTVTGNTDEVEAFTDFTIVVPESGDITFDWDYSTADALFALEEAGYVLNGNRTVLAGNTPASTSLVPEVVNVLAGDVFGFYVHSFDGFDEPGVITINNFSGPEPIPLPAPVLLLASALAATGLFRRR